MKYSLLKDPTFVFIEYIGSEIRPKLRSYTDEFGNYVFNPTDVNALLLWAALKSR